jgi:hypothetical protein
MTKGISDMSIEPPAPADQPCPYPDGLIVEWPVTEWPEARDGHVPITVSANNPLGVIAWRHYRQVLCLRWIDEKHDYGYFLAPAAEVQAALAAMNERNSD